MKHISIVVVALMATCCSIVNASDETLYSGIKLTETAFKKKKLPSSKALDSIIAEQEYDDDVPKVFTKDINGDGKVDYFIVTSDSLCGTGGCGYTLVDGKTLSKIGEFFGTEPIVSDSKVNNHAVIMFLKYDGPDKAALELWTFNKKKYGFHKSIALKGQNLVKQEKLLKVAK